MTWHDREFSTDVAYYKRLHRQGARSSYYFLVGVRARRSTLTSRTIAEEPECDCHRCGDCATSKDIRCLEGHLRIVGWPFWRMPVACSCGAALLDEEMLPAN